MKDLLKKIIFQLYCGLGIYKAKHRSLKKSGKVIVLCLHNIDDRDMLLYPSMSPRIFEKLIRYLSDNFEISSFDKIGKENSDKPRLILTFDDGESGYYKNALPVLKKHDIPSLQNVIVNSVEGKTIPWTHRLNALVQHIYESTSDVLLKIDHKEFRFNQNRSTCLRNGNQLYRKMLNLDTKKRLEYLQTWENEHQPNIYHSFMSWEDLKVCSESKVDIGSHTLSHELLSQLDEEEQKKEIFDSKRIIEEKLDISCQCLCFPNGFYNDGVLSRGKEAGYKYFLTTDSAYSSENEKLVHRISLNSNYFPELIYKLYNP